MNEKFVVLESSVRADLDAIEGLYTALGEPHLAEEDTEDELIVVAYRLHWSRLAARELELAVYHPIP